MLNLPAARTLLGRVPVCSAGFQTAVVALAVLLCGFLVWSVGAQPVHAGNRAAAPRVTQDDAGQPGVPPPVSDGPSVTPPPPAAAPPAAPPEATGSTAVQTKVGRTDPGKFVALTFDDGPWNTYTSQVLDILRQYNIKAVFCVVGDQAAALPGKIRAIVADGHTLCNHTMKHDLKMPEHTPDEMRAQMQAALDAIHNAAPGVPVPWYRAPGGKWSPQVQATAAALGMRSLGWSVDTTDWKKPGIDKMEQIVHQQLTPGAVILMHDGGGDRTMSVEFLRKLIPELLAQGYQFTVPV